MIGGLQGEFGDLDIKYLKKNISKCRSHISGSFRRTPRHCAKWLRNSLGKHYQRIRICLTGEVETSSSPIRRQAPDAKYPDGISTEKNSGCETSGWNVGGAEFWMWYIRVECRRVPLSGLPKGEAHGTRDHHTPNDSISYPDMLSEWKRLTFRRPPMVCSDIFCHGFQRTLLNLWLLWWSKSYQNTKT